MTAIKTIELTKKYKELVAVDKLDLQVEEGEIFALLGVNGAGKSTTIKMLSCLTKPTDGDAFILGKSIKTDPFEIKKMIGVSMQETAIARNLTVKENLDFFASVTIGDKKKQKDSVNEVIDGFSFNSVLGKRAKDLSGGWQRKLSVALAVLSKPKILFLDEPTLGLDVIARHELWSMIEKLKRQMTMILTTHYMEEAKRLSDRIGIMKDGRLLIVDNAENIISEVGAGNFEDAFVKIIERGGNIRI